MTGVQTCALPILIIKNFSIDKDFTPISLVGSEKLTDKIQIQWIKYNQETSEQTEQKEQAQQQSQIFSEIKLKIQDLVNPKFIKLTDFIPTLKYNTSLVGDYYKNFLEALIKVNFTDEELASIKIEQNGQNKERILLLEELMEQAISGINLNKLKNSFLAWHQLDERVLVELNKISVKPEILYLHKPMVDWFKYHSNLAKKLNEKNLSQNQVSQLFQQFQNDAKIHTSRFGKNLSKLKNSPDFVLIPTAQAFTCGAFAPPPFYHFGGRVILLTPCNWGIVTTISPPCGGIFLFSYPVLAANPYLWKKSTIGSTVLGRSTVAPGICPLGACPACVLFPYEAVVLYFGTSLTP